MSALTSAVRRSGARNPIVTYDRWCRTVWSRAYFARRAAARIAQRPTERLDRRRHGGPRHGCVKRVGGKHVSARSGGATNGGLGTTQANPASKEVFLWRETEERLVRAERMYGYRAVSYRKTSSSVSTALRFASSSALAA